MKMDLNALVGMVLVMLLVISNESGVNAQNSYPVLPPTKEHLFEKFHFIGKQNDRLIYTTESSSNEKSLWVSDGTSEGTKRVKTSNWTIVDIIGSIGDSWYFIQRVNDYFHITHLADESYELESIYSKSETIWPAHIWKENIYFSVERSGDLGDDLMKYIPDSQKIEVLFSSGFGGIRSIGSTDDSLFFIYGDNTGKYLGKSDGTKENTQQVHMLFPEGNEFSKNILMESNGNLIYFTYAPFGSTYYLWVSDGTSEGTKKLKEFENPSWGIPRIRFAKVGDKSYFNLHVLGGNSSDVRDLYVSDGTVEGTYSVNPTDMDYLSPSAMTVYNDRLYFRYYEPWNFGMMSTQGKKSNTEIILEPYGYKDGSYGRVSDIGLYDGKLIISASADDSGVSHLYSSDGTKSGTELLTEVVLDEDYGSPRNFMQVGKLLFFTQYVRSNRSLWVYNPDAKTFDCDDFVIDKVDVIQATSASLGSIKVHASGGVKPYQYRLNGSSPKLDSVLVNIEPGTYDLKIRDVKGCSTETNVTVEMNTSVVENSYHSGLKLYPNPIIGDVLTIEVKSYEQHKPITVSIHDSKGALFLKKEIKSLVESRIRVNTETLSEGIYTVSLSGQSKILGRSRFELRR